MKTILIFQSGELLRQVTYKSKKIAQKQLNLFKKWGYICPNTGNLILNTTFELL